MQPIKSLAVSAVFLFTPHQSVWADSIGVADPLVVTSSRLGDRVAIAGHITVIDAEQIESSPAKSLTELLQQEAGVTVRSLYGNGTRTTVDLRGFGENGTQNTLVLLDGRRLNDVDLSAINYAAIPLEQIERIEVMRGTGAVLYGDGAVGGAINIITKRASEGTNRGRVAAEWGSDSTQGLRGILQTQSDRLGLSAFVHHSESDGYRDNNDASQDDGYVDARWSFERAEAYLKLGAFHQALELPGARTVDPTINLNELKSDRRGTSTPNDWADEDTEFLTLGLTQQWSDSTVSVIDVSLRDKFQEAQFDYGFGFGDFNRTHIRTLAVTPRLQINHALFGQAAQSRLGVDYYHHDYDSSRSNFKTNIHMPIHELDIDQQSLAVYGQTVWDLNASTSVDLGARIQRMEIEARDTADPLAPGAFFVTEAADFDRDDTEHVLELGLQHQFLPVLSGYTRLGRSVRFSNVDELFEFNDFFVQVFSPLKPQTSRQIEVGLNYINGPVDATVSLYRMDLQNEIHFHPASFQNINLDDTRRTGFEFSLRRAFEWDAYVQLGYSYTRSEFVEGPFDDQTVPLVPRHKANVSYVQTLPAAVDLAVRWSYVGSSYFANDLSNTFGQKIPDYQTVDLKLSKQFDAFKVSALVNNLFDEEYYNFGVNSTFTPGRYNTYPLPERQWLLTLEYGFGN